MTTWSREDAEQIFEKAVDLPEKDRGDFLVDACSGNLELKAEVESLLEVESRMEEDFLEQGFFSSSEPIDEPMEGCRIGPYEIEQELGRGGMGRVFLASRADGEFEKKVALKLLEPRVVSREFVSQFREERQALANLEHRYIVPLFDGGKTDKGLPYFVMGYFEGEPIDVYCNRERLSVKERLRLFLKVCDAVKHAHGRMVIHRDLKPGNILVDRSGEPRLLDFGIAKVLAAEDGASSEARSRSPMTLAYASPEQILGGPMGVQTDVYSLGVLLYRLLVDRLPASPSALPGRSFQEGLLRAIPPKPSEALFGSSEAPSPEEVAGSRGVRVKTLCRQLAGDLDAILLKALEKSLEDRYRSVEELARDVENHLSSSPVEARRAGLFYEAKLRVRRHRWGFGAAAAAFAGLAAFALTMMSLRMEAREQWTRAEAATEVLVDALWKATPEEARGQELTSRELLDRSAQLIDERLANQPLILATLKGTIGAAEFQRGNLSTARALLGRAVELRRNASGVPRAEEATGLINLAKAERELEDFESSRALADEALALLKGRRRHFSLYLEALSVRGTLLRDVGDFEGAEAVWREILDRAQDLPHEDPLRLAHGKSQLALVLKLGNQLDEAEDLYREALASLLEIHEEPSAYIAQARSNLGMLLLQTGNLQEAGRLLRHALEDREKIYGPVHPLVANSLSRYALYLRRVGEASEAEEALRQALAVSIETRGAGTAKTARIQRHLGALLLDQGRAGEAEPEILRALESLERIYTEGHWELADVQSVYGALLVSLGRCEEAEPRLRDAHARLVQSKGEGDPATLEAAARLEAPKDGPCAAKSLGAA